MKTMILTGGGTAGHIVPNIALLPFLTDYEIHYIGEPDSMEEELIKAYPEVKFHAVKSVKFSRSISLKNLGIPFKLLKAKKQAAKIIKEINPSVIFSKGGFVALPAVLAAKKIPVVIHESDFSMGLANKMSLKKCKAALCSFESLAKSIPSGVHTGAPLRQSIYGGNKSEAERECRLIRGNNLLIFGGSLGAKSVNDVVFQSIDTLTKYFNIVHITGKNNDVIIENKPNYFQIPFTNKMADYYAWADIVISRGGANALFEIVALKKPALVIPLPKSGSSRGDQEINADYFEKMGCIKVLKQDESFNCKTLIENTLSLFENKNQLKINMQNAKNIDGTRKIAEILREF